MKIQVIYSSLSGCTKKLAQGIYDGLGDAEKSIWDLADGTPVLDGDILLLGYWVDKGGPNAQMKAFMDKLEAIVQKAKARAAGTAHRRHRRGEGEEYRHRRLCVQRPHQRQDD